MGKGMVGAGLTGQSQRGKGIAQCDVKDSRLAAGQSMGQQLGELLMGILYLGYQRANIFISQ